VELSHGIHEYTAWLAGWFPDEIARWSSEMQRLGCRATDYLPIPAHPWQLEHRIRVQFADAIADGHLVLLQETRLPQYTPLMSFRTLTPLSDTRQPDIKMPIDIALTSVRRTISPRTCQMTPRTSTLVQEIFDRDPEVGTDLRLQPELCAVHYRDAHQPVREKQLAVVFRRPTAEMRVPGTYLMPCAALFVDSPLDGEPLILSLMRHAVGGCAPRDCLRFFSAYVSRFLPGLLRLYLVYGITLEAHHQNTLMLIDQSHDIKGFVLRDSGGIRLHRPTLEKMGLRLELHEDRLTVREDRESVRQKFLGTIMYYHLGQLVLRLHHATGVPSQALWQEIMRQVCTVFARLEPHLPGKLWLQERRGFLEEDWQVKALMRMNLSGSYDAIYLPIPNPFRQLGHARRQADH
jgi:D-ornithine---citrate ligase